MLKWWYMNPDNNYQPLKHPDPQPPAQPSFRPQGQPAPYQQPMPNQQPPQNGYAAPAPTNPAYERPVPLAAAGIEPVPQQVSPNDPYPLDYLNQIAPVEKKSVNKFAVFALIGSVLLVAIAAVILFASSGPPDFSTQAKAVQSRITTLQTVADAQQSHLKETAISEANSSLASALTSMDAELSTIMKTKGIKKSPAAAKSTEKAYADALSKKLDDSYQRGTLDRTYAAQMTYELTVLKSRLNRMKNSANSKSVTTYVNSAVVNIDAILKAYSKFSATK